MFLKILLFSKVSVWNLWVICWIGCLKPIQFPPAVTVYDRTTPRAKFCHYIHHNLVSQLLLFSLAADGKPLKMLRINGKSKVIYYWGFGHIYCGEFCLFNLDIFNYKMLNSPSGLVTWKRFDYDSPGSVLAVVVITLIRYKYKQRDASGESAERVSRQTTPDIISPTNQGEVSVMLLQVALKLYKFFSISK